MSKRKQKKQGPVLESGWVIRGSMEMLEEASGYQRTARYQNIVCQKLIMNKGNSVMYGDSINDF